MNIFKSIFNKNKRKIFSPFMWDVHNHILPGIDDGAHSMEHSLKMAELFIENGYDKIIATPHILSDFYKNTPDIIRAKHKELSIELASSKIQLEIEFAAEYFIDEVFMQQVKTKEGLLTFHGNHILVETTFMNKPYIFEKALFDLKIAGYQPVLAHPERYIFLQQNVALAESLIENGIKFQINLLSLSGYYSKGAQKMAEWLIKHGYYSFFGTDAHTPLQLTGIQKVFSCKLFSKIDMGKVENAKV